MTITPIENRILSAISIVVGKYFDVSTEALSAIRRDRVVTAPRQWAQYIAREVFCLKFREIGYFFNKGHAASYNSYVVKANDVDLYDEQKIIASALIEMCIIEVSKSVSGEDLIKVMGQHSTIEKKVNIRERIESIRSMQLPEITREPLSFEFDFPEKKKYSRKDVLELLQNRPEIDLDKFQNVLSGISTADNGKLGKFYFAANVNDAVRAGLRK